MALRLATLLFCAALLPGCGGVERTFSRMTDGLTDISLRAGPQWGGPRTPVEDSITVQRVRAGGTVAPSADLATLRPEAGDVWPREEAPRATLANPDEALRGLGNQRMGMSDPASEAARPSRRGSSSPPPDPLLFPPPNEPRNVVSPVVPMPEPPPRARRTDDVGGVLPTTRGPATVTTRSGNVGTTVSPGGGTGVAIQDGGMTTIIRPGLPPEQIPTPR